VIATHLGNAIVKYDNAISIDPQFMSGFYDRLQQTGVTHGETIDEEHVRTEGKYIFDKTKIVESPQRFTDLSKLTSEEDQLFVKNMRSIIHRCVREYVHTFPVVAECIRWSTDGYVIKYENGQSIGPHSDCSIAYADDGVTPINTFPMQNIITCGLMLNDDYEGGAISYRPWGITTRPDAGSVLIYPSSYVGCHEVAPITSGVRYAYLMWYGHGPIGGFNHRTVDDVRGSNSSQDIVLVGQLPLYE